MNYGQIIDTKLNTAKKSVKTGVICVDKKLLKPKYTKNV